MRYSLSLRTTLLLLLATLIGFGGAAWTAEYDWRARQTPAPTGRIVLEFQDATGLTVEQGRISPATTVASRLEALLETVAPDFELERHFSRSPAQLAREREQAEARTGRVMPNLNRYARLVPRAGFDRERLLDVVAELRRDPAIETAFLEPVAVPAALGFDAFTGRFDPAAARLPAGTSASGPQPPQVVQLRQGELLPTTPDFTDMQGYLDAAPTGIDAEGVWANPGGTGDGLKVLDIEGAWLWDHEDLPDPFFTAGGQFDDEGWRNHGTAVLGEIRGTMNSYGVTGIAHDAQVGGVSVAELSVADAINTASANLDPGDIFLIELHSPGPNANGEGQYGYVCMEFWQDNFDAIQLATANGRICIEAAGNGEQDLDDPVYMGLFDRNVRDSGAIMCGASNGSSLEPAWFTNHGSRVDLHGWGYDVVTCGYGGLQGGPETEWYTESFSGTSSASPIVLGSVALLQTMTQEAFGISLSAKLARDILVATGTPQSGTEQIGPRPDLTAAWALASTGVGAVRGLVTDAVTGDPIPEVLITDQESGAFVHSGADGAYYIPLLAGSRTLVFDSFFYEIVEETVGVSAGGIAQLPVALTPRPTVAVTGRVLGGEGWPPLEGVRVTPLAVPFDAVVSDPTGDWSIGGLPDGQTYRFLFDQLVGYGADYDTVDASGGREAYGLIVQLPLTDEDFESDDGGFTTSGDPLWSHGTPSAGGPATGFSGTRCWGVGMSDNYPDQASGYLESPLYDFSTADELRLSFHFWCETEPGFDGANVQVYNNGTGEWDLVRPFEDYNSLVLGGLEYQSGWSGSTGGWKGAVFDLGDYISETVRFRIKFGSDWGLNDLGFWIDDIAFDEGNSFSSVPEEEAFASGLSFAAPGLARGTARIALALPEATEADVAIFDATGRRVRALHQGALPAGRQEWSWDGRDAYGRAVASGVYFVRLQTPQASAVRRVVMSR